MRRHLIRCGVIAACLAATAVVHAQEATEMFIPIGQSPGVSGKTSIVGALVAVNPAAGTMTVAAPAGARTVKINDRTRIWLDRSRLKLPNLEGTLADLQPGRKVEVKPEQGPSGAAADWIKVEVADAAVGSSPAR